MIFLRIQKEGISTRFVSESSANDYKWDVVVNSAGYIKINNETVINLNSGLNIITFDQRTPLLHRTFNTFNSGELLSIETLLNMDKFTIIASTVNLDQTVINTLKTFGAELYVSSDSKYVASYKKSIGFIQQKMEAYQTHLEFTGIVDVTNIDLKNSSIGVNGFIVNEVTESNSNFVFRMNDYKTQTNGNWYTKKVNGLWVLEYDDLLNPINRWFVYDANIGNKHKILECNNVTELED